MCVVDFIYFLLTKILFKNDVRQKDRNLRKFIFLWTLNTLSIAQLGFFFISYGFSAVVYLKWYIFSPNINQFCKSTQRFPCVRIFIVRKKKVFGVLFNFKQNLLYVISKAKNIVLFVH